MPKVSIGMPVYNGENFVSKCIESILSQTHSNFELIISDNASTDNTSTICKEFASKNKRIRYFRQEKKIGMNKNFRFVFEKAGCNYFVWVSSDDFWLPTFLEKNIKVLETEKKYVGSISRIEYFDGKNLIQPKPFFKIKKYYTYDEYPSSGNFEDRVKFYLRLNKGENIFSVFRTDIIKKYYNVKQCAGVDSIIILGALKFGEINILDEVLMYRSAKGISGTSGDNNLTRFNDYGLVGRILPFLPLTLFVGKNLGLKVFFENLDYLLYINLSALKYQFKHGFK